MRIGIYGGSFDPIHTGHSMLANYISQMGVLDEVWLMVSPLNPFKKDKKLTSDSQRLDMVRLVAEESAAVEASDFEFDLPKPSYTYKTLCELRNAYPDHKFSLIIGSDNWQEIARWKDPEKIIEEFGILIYPRPGYDVELPLPAGVTMLEGVPLADISSTLVRRMAGEGKNISFLVPDRVRDYIMKNRLYRKE